MSNDVAVLGLAVDSSAVKTATADLNSFAASAKPAASAATALSVATDAHSVSLRGQHEVLRGAIDDIALLGGQYGQIGSTLANLYIGNSRLAEGMGGLRTAVAGLLTPTNLLIGGFAGIAVGGALAYESIKNSELAFDDVSKSIGITIGQLHGLDTAAAGKGIDTAELQKAMTGFGASVYQALAGMGSLSDVFRANNVQAGNFNDALAKAAGLIANAGTNQQKLALLTQMGLPATMQWVNFMSQGADAIKAAINNTGDFNDAAEANLIASARKFDEEWNTAWKNFDNNAKSAMVDGIGLISQLSSAADNLAKTVGNSSFWKNFTAGATPASVGLQPVTGGDLANGRVSQGFSAHANQPVNSALQQSLTSVAQNMSPGGQTVDPAVLQHQIQLQQQYIGLLGSTASADQIVQAVELARQAAAIKGVSITNAQETALENLAREQALGITAIKQQTDAQNVETATVGMSVGAAAEYAAAQNAINAAKLKGMPLTADNIASIKAEATALGQASQNTDDLKWAFTSLDQGPLEAFTASIAQGSNAMVALEAAGTSALNAIAKKLADMAANNLWQAAFGGSSGGLLSSLFGIGGATGAVNASGSITGAVGATSIGGAPLIAAGLHGGGGPGDSPTFTRVLPAALFNSAPRFHSGIGPGEQAAVIRNDESVLTPGQMKQLGPSGGQPIYITNNNDFTGADPQTEARLKTYVDQSSARAVQQAVQAVQSAKNTSPQFLRSGR